MPRSHSRAAEHGEIIGALRPLQHGNWDIRSHITQAPPRGTQEAELSRGHLIVGLKFRSKKDAGKMGG